MRSDKFCFQCGGHLDYYDGTLECSSCGASYSNLIISETECTEDGFRVLEIGVCFDITLESPVEPAEIVDSGSSLTLSSPHGTQGEIPA